MALQNTPAAKHIVMDMTTTRPEFFRCLEIALAGKHPAINGDHIVVDEQSGTVNLDLAPLPPRQLSSTLHLERWQLTIEFDGQSETERTQFMNTFHRAFHRGGG